MIQKIKNIGILSHVDAGKTTLTEHILYLSGVIKQPGDVNKGATVSDNLEIEKQRGVSVRSTDVSFFWKDHQINLIDTPGHADFSAEVERSLQIMDGAILVISAVEGIQAHTHALWEALRRKKIPTLIFINKIDRAGADFANILTELENEFLIKTFPLFFPINESSSDAKISKVSHHSLSPEMSSLFNRAIENLAGLDDEILNLYLESNIIDDDLLMTKIRNYAARGQLFAVVPGVAKNSVGVGELMDAVTKIFPNQEKSSDKLSALVYKIQHHPTLGRLAYVRVFDGELKVRDNILNVSANSEGKIAQIKKSDVGRLVDHSIIQCNDIGIISGLPGINTGDVLGSHHKIPPAVNLDVPMMTVQILPVDENDFVNLANALEILYAEDPRLSFRWYKSEKELHLNLMGKIQMEVIQTILEQRFNVKAKFGSPSVIYKETPLKAGRGFAEYTMPKPCWAVVVFAIEPGLRGSGVVYQSQVSVDKIKQKYQNEILAAIPKALEQGIKGWEVTDVKIILFDGEDHEIHSRPGDFAIAVPMAIMNGLSQIGVTLLEPVLSFTIKASEDLLGKISGDIHLMRGSFETPVFDNGTFVMRGKVPAATSLEYGTKLSSLSGGKAMIRFAFSGYEPCTDDQGVIRNYKGVNPLDRSRWILHSRGAYKSDDRK
jgi:ribosomal protection tetracycline resistance protein